MRFGPFKVFSNFPIETTKHAGLFGGTVFQKAPVMEHA